MYYITTGILKRIQNTGRTLAGVQNFHKIIRDILSSMNIVHGDPCCPALVDSRPAKYNKSTGAVQYLDVDNKTWVDVPNLTNTVRVTSGVLEYYNGTSWVAVQNIVNP